MHSKIAMSPFASMLPHLCENDNNFEIKLRIDLDIIAKPRKSYGLIWKKYYTCCNLTKFLLLGEKKYFALKPTYLIFKYTLINS